jgi:hypothetical protein
MPFPIDDAPTVLWTLHLDGKVASGDVRFVMWGNEVRVLRNGRLLFSRVFATGEEALKEAEQERERMLGDGWKPLESSPCV